MLRLFLTLLMSLAAVVLTSCDGGTLNPLPEGYDPDGRCSAGKNQILPEEEWDSLQARCDTVFIRDTVIVYGDTVYEDTVVTKHDYIGFKYFNRYTEDYDTLVGIRIDERPELSDSYRCGHRPVYCDLDSSQKTFSCQTGIICYTPGTPTASALQCAQCLNTLIYCSASLLAFSICSQVGFGISLS